MRKLEHPVAMIQRLGQPNDPGIAVENPQRTLDFLKAGSLDCNPMVLLQPRLQHPVGVMRIAGIFGADTLGGCLEPWEVIPIIPEEIVNQRLWRGRNQFIRNAPLAHVQHLVQRGAMRLIQMQELLDELWRMIQRTAKLLQVRWIGAKNRILHCISQICQPDRRIVAHKIPPINGIGIRQCHQHRHRQTALIGFQQPDIGCAHIQYLGHLSLGLLVIAPQLPKPRADEGFGSHHTTLLQNMGCVDNTINTTTRFREKESFEYAKGAATICSRTLKPGCTEENLMSLNILILGASYGSLLGTKMLMAGHNVTLVCRQKTAALINAEGTEVRIKLKGEDTHRAIFSNDLPGKLDAQTPDEVDPTQYDMVGLAMQEPQYGNHDLWTLMTRIADARVPCLSIMNMPPLPYLKRIPALADMDLDAAFTQPRVWDRFDPDLMSLCSPDPQAFRPPEEANNVLHVGLPTNFKAAPFGAPEHNEMLNTLANDIAGVTLDGNDVPVKLRVHDSLFVPLAKWSMLLTGNYRCVLTGGNRPIRDAVHSDLDQSRAIYAYVDDLARHLGADAADQVPFEKYAKAAESLLKPSSAARAIASGAPVIERVDRLIQLIGQATGRPSAEVDETVATVDGELNNNQVQAA